MSEGVIAGRYATALYKYCAEHGVATTLYKTAEKVEKAFISTSELRKTLINPVVPAKDKISIMMTVGGKNADKYFENFVRLVVDKKREEYMREIFLKYSQIYRKKNNISLVEVTTAVDIDENMLEKITSIISSRTDSKVELKYKIDPAIIGGFILKIDSQQLDASIDRELKNLRLKLVNSNKV